MYSVKTIKDFDIEKFVVSDFYRSCLREDSQLDPNVSLEQ